MNVSVMTFNIRGSLYQHDGVNIWANRAGLNVETIKKVAPDVIGFQELHPGNLATYLVTLPEYHFVLGPPSDEPDAHDYNPIFWKADRFEFQDSGGFYLSETPEHWSKSWDGSCFRSATWVKLLCKESDTKLLLLNTHLDHIGEQARVAGSHLILDKLTELNSARIPTILTGDFNCNPWTPDYGIATNQTSTDESYRLFVKHGFTDTYLAAGNIDSMQSYTHHGFEGDAYSALNFHMAWRLDWILTRGTPEKLVNTITCEILRDALPPLYPSDHYPILAKLKVKYQK
jgi:endonuclease/exonuclease/phosphatase family metal-dependent hydrolase